MSSITLTEPLDISCEALAVMHSWAQMICQTRENKKKKEKRKKLTTSKRLEIQLPVVPVLDVVWLITCGACHMARYARVRLLTQTSPKSHERK